nr:MAG TPA: hypothetical protein [Caudoviricetes sp.]
MNRNEKVYYAYVENGKAVITEEKPDFNKIKNYTMVKANGIECVIGGKKIQDDLTLPDEPVDVAAMLTKATIVTDAPVFAPLSPMLESKLVAIPKYDPVQLQEIAEHLLVHCNAQERGYENVCCEDCKSESV